MLENPPEEFTQAMEDFLIDSISHIHGVQDPARYLRWVKENYQHYFAAFVEDDDPQSGIQVALATARRIWNATPLKSNRYQPKPLPDLGRNERCYCDSGKKFKQCCQFIYSSLPINDQLETWPQLLGNLSAEELIEALESKAIPTQVLIDIAADAFDDGVYDFTCKTLGMIFEYQPEMLKEYGNYAVQLMCDAFEELEDDERKFAFLEAQRKSEFKQVRSSAWQRTAATHLLMGENDAAWEALHTARKISPDAPTLDTLELYMLLDEERFDLAGRRAEMLLQQWRRQNRDQEMPEQFAFIQQVANSPEEMLAMINESESENDLESDVIQRLSASVKSASMIALPTYQIEEMHAGALDTDPLQRDKCYTLETPDDLQALEAQWYQVYTGETPAPGEAFTDPTNDSVNAQQWLDFLDQHPQAFNSIAILDDLIALLECSGYQSDEAVYQQIFSPIFERVERIFASLYQNQRFDWGFMQNRPLLRLLLNQITIRWFRGEFQQSKKLMERLLCINPNDNQGIRGILMNAYLKQDEDQNALDLAQLYPDDALAEIILGRVLALYRLGQRDQANEQWTNAQKLFKHAKRYLCQSKIKPAEAENSFGEVFGSKEEMWHYREEMRDTWLKTRGVIGWLK